MPDNDCTQLPHMNENYKRIVVVAVYVRMLLITDQTKNDSLTARCKVHEEGSTSNFQNKFFFRELTHFQDTSFTCIDQ